MDSLFFGCFHFFWIHHWMIMSTFSTFFFILSWLNVTCNQSIRSLGDSIGIAKTLAWGTSISWWQPTRSLSMVPFKRKYYCSFSIIPFSLWSIGISNYKFFMGSVFRPCIHIGWALRWGKKRRHVVIVVQTVCTSFLLKNIVGKVLEGIISVCCRHVIWIVSTGYKVSLAI